MKKITVTISLTPLSPFRFAKFLHYTSQILKLESPLSLLFCLYFPLKKMLDKERLVSFFMDSFLLWAVLLLDLLLFKVSGNAEVNALIALKNNLADPNNVLQSWDPTQVNPCMWFRVRCNSDNRVTHIDLGDENLSGQLVPQLGQLLNLQYLELYQNNISGKIPDEFGNLTNLVSLDLYLNKLTGPIPDTLGNLEKLLFLRLNNNSLSGSIPMSFTRAVSLQFLDLSNNQLIGYIPVNGSFSLFTPISFQNNPGLKQQKFSSPSSISPEPPAAPSGNSTTGAIAGGFAVGIFVLSFAAYAIAFTYWRRRKPKDHFFDALAQEDFDKILHGELNQFVLYDLQVATDNFSHKNVVGIGGSGTVYKGRLPDGSLVAVKRIRERNIQGGKQAFEAEMKMISMARHRNLLRLIGFCRTPTECLLVYPFMVNRCVASCLQELPRRQPPLDWPTRKRIALGAARGIAYLHDHCDLKIIHCDIKASNILLDGEFEAFVGDFGLAKLMDFKYSHITTSVRGTVGHIDPEFLSTGKISEKSDVFGYGVLLLELITGQKANNSWYTGFSEFRNNFPNFPLIALVKQIMQYQELERLVDADLEGNYNKEEVEQVTRLALLCTQESSINRPKMSEVVIMLEDGDGLAEKWEIFQKDIFPQDFNHTYYDPNFNWIGDSTSISYLSEDELSLSPR